MYPPAGSAIGSSAPLVTELFYRLTFAPNHLMSAVSFSHTPPASENLLKHAGDHLADRVNSLKTKSLTVTHAKIPVAGSSNRERIYRIQ